MALITKDDLKLELGSTQEVYDDSYEELLSAMAAMVQDLFDQLCDRTLERTSHEEYYSNTRGGSIILLKNFPVEEGSVDLWDDPDWEWGTSDKVDSSDYRVDYNKGVIYSNSQFFEGNQSLKVTYTAGYTTSTLPSSIKRILVRQACHWFNQAKNKAWAVTGQGNPADGGSVSYLTLERNLLPDFNLLVERERIINA